MKVDDVRADRHDFSDEFVADDHRNGNRAACPLVPFVYVDVGSTYAGAADTNEDVINADRGFGNIGEPEAFFGARFNEGLHRENRNGSGEEVELEVRALLRLVQRRQEFLLNFRIDGSQFPRLDLPQFCDLCQRKDGLRH